MSETTAAAAAFFVGVLTMGALVLYFVQLLHGAGVVLKVSRGVRLFFVVAAWGLWLTNGAVGTWIFLGSALGFTTTTSLSIIVTIASAFALPVAGMMRLVRAECELSASPSPTSERA